MATILQALLLACTAFRAVFAQSTAYDELYRPQYHFTPAKDWMNDPNGLLYHDGIYHLFFQYNLGGETWGNISWGHATSRDLTHWEQQPVALLARGYPNNVTEMFFSGSAVVDNDNTSGFGKNGKTPLVAMYTSYYPYEQVLPSGKTVQANQQAQSIAYSLDDGMTWTTHDEANPVILDPPAPYEDQFLNFRDPNIFWHAPTENWIAVLSLAELHMLVIYTSKDLKNWSMASEFGPVNAVGGAWECPNLFPLPVDGSQNHTKWVAMIGVNPGGPPGTIGSGTQYVIGDFNGTTFNADADNVYSGVTPLPSDSIIFANFEGTGSFADLGWNATGDLVGQSPAHGTLPGQSPVTGYLGKRLVNTFLNGDVTTGTLTSTPFTISMNYINFLIGGGDDINNTAVYLKVDGKIVRSATGANSETLLWQSWDVSDLLNQTAAIEIVDTATTGWGHINVDEISFSNSIARSQVANWVDLGPDFYAAQGYNGLSTPERIVIGWMNNWQYGGLIPTSPWRSAMSIPRLLSLKTIGEKPALVQAPAENWATLIDHNYRERSWLSMNEGTEPLGRTGKAMKIELEFSDRSPAASGTSQFGIIVRATADLTQQTRVGYDFATKEVFIDRSKSGNVSFESTFASTYSTPLASNVDGKINMLLYVDWSSIELFGGDGETTMTTQIFPSDSATYSQIFSTGGDTTNVRLRIAQISSTWNGS
ncbi:exoinulinase InuD [Penicillium verhagenii]|uniref:exoinulinase InuD n=1 Tax=Penicillium verhagenii TaxID=1562060 RepID=UPI00254554CC|nr:exoinulinase InuD [Penicillium verhagenii]KAJ5930348.1 exoinulinase InuD [Penicillium verhagenii]